MFLLFSIHSVLVFELIVVLPFCYRDTPPDATYFLHIFAGCFIYANVMCNLWKLIVTDSSSAGMELPVLMKPGWRFCSACECNSPARSFHCNTCNICILKRDHHCLFTGNCVGFHNQRFYIHLIFYIWLAAVYANIMNIDFVYHTFGGYSLKTIFSLVLPLFAWCLGVVQTMSLGAAFMITLCLVGITMTSALLAYHLNNVIKGQTVYENTFKIRDYDLGCKENIKSVFGDRWYMAWIFPMIPSPLPGNGMDFKTKKFWESSKDM